MLNSLTYTYLPPDGQEPLGGERYISITVSDGLTRSTIIITIDVQVLNNNPPILAFAGDSSISYLEESSTPLAVGSVLQLQLTDADNVTVFQMQGASVHLDGAVDGTRESITAPNPPNSNVRVNGEY